MLCITRLANSFTSSCEMRPPGPDPGTCVMSTPISRASRRTEGAAGAFDAFLHHGKLSIKDNVYDGDTSGGFRKLVQIVFGLSIAFAASSFFLSFFSFAGGAVLA